MRKTMGAAEAAPREQSDIASGVNTLLAQAFDRVPHGQAIANTAGIILHANRQFRERLGLSSVETSLPDILFPAGRMLADGVSQVVRNERRLTVEVQSLAGDHRLIVVDEALSAGKLSPAVLEFVHQDSLTALPNRAGFLERLNALSSAQRAGLVVLCLDLDRFKLVNDTLGHSAGDILLQKVAERLRSAIDRLHTIARMGGDEFAVVLIDESPNGAERLAGRLVDLLGRSYLVEDAVVNTGVSIGIAYAEGHQGDLRGLLKSADLALYAAKEDGRGRFRVFEPAMDERMQARRSLEFQLRKALGLRQFQLLYQPQLNFERNRIEGCEALLRWQHPERGVISPADFIPLAEEIGAIVPIGEWVLRTACMDAARWPDHIKVAVNLSAVQFTSDRLVPVVVGALASSGLAPERLELEITESVLLNDTPATLATLHKLRGLNVRISMDDFGTGYSSLSYLRSFPFDKIKIDQSFVRNRAKDKDCIAIVRAIAGLGASLGITTTAEGVETQEQQDWVRSEGCTEMQGYLLSKPVAASILEELLTEPKSA